jgi:hypothetical protein
VARVLYGLGRIGRRHQVQGGLWADCGVARGRPGLRMGGVGGVIGSVPRAEGPQHGGGVPF